MRQGLRLAMASCVVLALLGGCGSRWPVSPEHAKAVVRTFTSPKCRIIKVTVARVTTTHPLAPGREVYPVKITFADATGEHIQLWAVDAVTGQGFAPDPSTVAAPPADAAPPPAPSAPAPLDPSGRGRQGNPKLVW